MVDHIPVRLNVVTCWFLGPGLNLTSGVSMLQLPLSETRFRRTCTPHGQFKDGLTIPPVSSLRPKHEPLRTLTYSLSVYYLWTSSLTVCVVCRYGSINWSINQSSYLSRNSNKHWTGHQGKMQLPLTGARKNKVSKSNKWQLPKREKKTSWQKMRNYPNFCEERARPKP